ncbi:MAG TPA: hypothetical protein VFB33_10475 [Candidatus Binataceae bacterium]|nr:hypothetical protein [Candidatus Binataceae bacterium]
MAALIHAPIGASLRGGVQSEAAPAREKRHGEFQARKGRPGGKNPVAVMGAKATVDALRGGGRALRLDLLLDRS